ncbi:hypothetical protein [Streptomyces sp. NBC_01304]|uniref:hypothetical protein n=1 Tax=Streptomyces sp. NBC_01304 TaxID=2903818 RepID=UPI002E112394|nr:hypothetical protein OG430_23350 [Streptomyces sp. NBC_01304]
MAATPGVLRGRPVRLAMMILALVLAATGATLYFSGAYDDWRDGRALSRACDGILPQDELPQLLDWDGRLTSDEAWSLTARDARTCTVYSPELEDHNNTQLSLTVSQGRGSRQLLTDLAVIDERETVTPIGNGWRGILNVQSELPKATVVMPCGKKPDDALVVHLETWSGPYDNDSAGQRARLARVVTQAAANAADQAGCDAAPGERVERVPGELIKRSDTPKPAGTATGTCRDVPAPALETAADPLAPIENCVLKDRTGHPSDRLTAYYGPFVQHGHADLGIADSARFAKHPAGSIDGLSWASADCPKQGGPAFFTAQSLPGSDADLPAGAFKQFALRSAKGHGCEVPVFSN